MLPPELQRSAPRDVTLNGSGWVAAICAVALLVGGVVGGWWLAESLAADAVDAAKLRGSGISTDAVVSRVRRTRGDTPQVTISYRYAAAGREFERGVKLRPGDPLRRTIDIGSRVRVVYLPSEPGKSWLKNYCPHERPLWLAAILPGVCVPCALLMVSVLRRQSRLLEDGRAVMARVTSAEKKSNGEDSWRITYSWRLLNGAARSAHMDRSTQPSGSGSFLLIVYDRDNPERHSHYPLSLVKLR